MSSFQPFSFTCRVGACERAFTCFFSGIGSKVHETLRVSFGPRSHLVPNLVRASFQERFLKELGHLNAWCCYWSGAWCCCWCCCCWVLLLLVLPLVLYWGLSRKALCSQRSFGHDDLERSASFAQLFFHVVKAAFHAVL